MGWGLADRVEGGEGMIVILEERGAVCCCEKCS